MNFRLGLSPRAPSNLRAAPRGAASSSAVVPSVVAAIALGLAGCQQANEYVPPPPPLVTVAQPVEREIVHQLEFTGNIRATDTVDVRARVNGYLQQIAFEDGADVETGDLLFVIEPAPFIAALDSARAEVQKAEASLELAAADLARTEPLVKRGALTAQELDVKRADVATAKADVASAKAAQVQAQLNLDYTQVKSPISGRVSRHLVDVGNLVQAEQTILTRVESFDPIHAYFAVSESDVLEFIRIRKETGAPSIREQAPPLYLGLSGEEGFPHEGMLDFQELGVDPQTGTQLRRGIFPNEDKQLVPGLFARLRLPVGDPEPGLMIPDRAIATDQRGEYVLVVNEKHIVEYRPVELGLRVADMRVVASGVEADDWIVINGLQRARVGAEVKPEKAEAVKEAEGLAAANDPAILPSETATATTTRPTASGAGGQ